MFFIYSKFFINFYTKDTELHRFARINATTNRFLINIYLNLNSNIYEP